MVGRKFFMALVREFQELCHILSCQNVQSSPTHSNVTRAEQQKPTISSLSPIKEEEDEDVNDEMGNKPLKFPDFDASAYQEHVLNILRQEKAPLKESTFSPYAPLPAIGKSSFETTHPHNQSELEISTALKEIGFETTELHKRIERQLTYRVLNPIYIKGPYDLHKFPSIKSNFMLEGGILKRNTSYSINNSPKDKKLLNISGNGKESKAKPVKFLNSVPGRSLQPSKHFLIEKEKLKSKDINKENTSAFWIDF